MTKTCLCCSCIHRFFAEDKGYSNLGLPHVQFVCPPILRKEIWSSNPDIPRKPKSLSYGVLNVEKFPRYVQGHLEGHVFKHVCREGVCEAYVDAKEPVLKQYESSVLRLMQCFVLIRTGMSSDEKELEELDLKVFKLRKRMRLLFEDGSAIFDTFKPFSFLENLYRSEHD